MAYLLDTNAVIWAANNQDLLGKNTKIIFESETLFVSSVTVFEYTIKTMLGKLSFDISPEVLIDKLGVNILDFTADHAVGVGGFPELKSHDPFDRMLLSQAKLEGLTLLTSDQKLLALNLPYVLDSRL
jgi:PIN domain nuclease of toxin-antitoxin system